VMVCCFAGCNKQPANTESNSSGISSADAILSSDMNVENSKLEENSTVSNLSSNASVSSDKQAQASSHQAAAASSSVSSKVTSSSQEQKPQVRQYYTSAIGLWYTVWWDSEGQPYYDHHWTKETRTTPARFGRYATDDTKKLKWDFNYFKKIGIDYLILDDTNNHQADGGNIASHINACFKLANSLGTSGTPKLCIAGGNPLLHNQADLMESEMSIFKGYATKYSNIYFQWKGKPLFVNFVSPQYFKYTNANFTIRNACGHTSEAKTAAEAGKYNLNEQGLYGWVFDYEFKGAEAYGVNPGWSRSHNGLEIGKAEINRENGDLYRRLWLRALKAKPETIVIASWNDHAEETGIEAVNLSEDIAGREAEKKNPYLYEQMTEGYLALKTGYVKGYYYKAENDSNIYQYTGSKLQKVSSVPENGVLLWIPDDYYDWAGVARG
ncbi:MAG: hypothetical protein PUB00_06630, partial [Clostridiales bacterium]|nr:hypothetical protein [Clostridiales bacterium]